MTETLAYGYSSESTQPGLSKEYQYDMLKFVFKKICVFVLWPKVASTSEGLKVGKLFSICFSSEHSVIRQL